MMRLNVFLSFILMLTVTSIAAEETDSDLWNWAWHGETGALLAYSDSGKIETLLAEGVSRSYDVWRLGSDDAIGLLEIADQAVFYRLSAWTAQPLHTTFDLQSLRDPFQSRYGYRLETYHAPYVVFTPITAQDQRTACCGPNRSRHFAARSPSSSLAYGVTFQALAADSKNSPSPAYGSSSLWAGVPSAISDTIPHDGALQWEDIP